MTYRVLASCYAHMGRLNDAREIVTRLRVITPTVTEPGTRHRNADLHEPFLSDLRLATGETSWHPHAVLAVLRLADLSET